jgi:tetratricopeptide (TPR) repeat protein
MLVSIVTMGCASGGAVRAQQSDGAAELAQIEERIGQGRLDGAAEDLARWLAASPAAAPEELGRARYLQARLHTNADSARAGFLAVALDGRSSYGALAWLRLAQLDLAGGDAARAIEDLRRLRADFPAAPIAAQSWYWSARAQETRGDLEAACDDYARAVSEARSALDEETTEVALVASAGCTSGGLRFALQLGAFSRRSAAEDLAATVREAGYAVRIVSEEGLQKVRVGSFGSAESARTLADRLRAAGYSVAVVASES